MDALRALCQDGARRAQDEGLAAELSAIAAQLDLPLQLAVAGAVSAGKSTLINALLRRPVARADAGECTRIVTWYENGLRDGRVLVECASGAVVEMSLDASGRLPTPNVPANDVIRLRVQLDEPRLRAVTVIDTPGVNTVTADNEDATRRLLFGDSAAVHAQALIYVLRYVQRFDADTLGEFRTLSAACGLTAVNTAAVLSQIDRRGGQDDPWPIAWRLTERATEQLRGVALDVAPVIGLLAETARGGLLTHDAIAVLREMALLPEDDLDDLLLDLKEFTTDDGAGTSVAIRAELVDRLHRFGIREAIAHLRRHPEADADTLHLWLAERSGFGPLDRPDPARPTVADVLDRFTDHADRLKAYHAMVRLRGLAHRPDITRADTDVVSDLLGEVDENRPIAEGLRALRVLAAVAAMGQGVLRLDEQMTTELISLARSSNTRAQFGLPPDAPTADVRAASVAASVRWRRAALLTGPTVEGHRMLDVLGALEDITAELVETPTPTSSAPPPTIPEVPPLHGRELLSQLRDSGLVGPDERTAISDLLASTNACTAVGLSPDTPPDEIADRAADLVVRFRMLLHRPLPGPERRAVEAACDAYEQIVFQLRAAARTRSTG